MKPDFDRILRLAYEIEGLALLLKSREGEGIPAGSLELLAEKTVMLQGAVMQLPVEQSEPTEPIEPTGPTETAPAPETTAPQECPAPPVPDPEPAPAVAPAAIEPAGAAETVETVETVEERLARERARDIFRAFSINDKFRFTRELFRGSEQEFSDTLATISAMSDFAEAEEYFYDDLCWDPSDADVESFMEIVKRHF